MVRESLVREKLHEIADPELGINIVDLGLIYNVSVKSGVVAILMTLTFPGCPLGSIISKEINDKIGSLDGVKRVNLKITFNPPWDLSKINPEARAELGI
jgi:metal-sulfur cluster biosynthetic enzyme